MTVRYFVIGDIHGHFLPFQEALSQWNRENETLIQLGDLVDRGPDSVRVVREWKRLVEEEGAKVCSGNHEKMFLSFLDEPEEEGPSYFDAGGHATVRSFLGEEVAYRYTPAFIADRILTEYPEEIAFLRSLPSVLEEGDWVFVHAGVNLHYRDWRNSTDRDYLWTRKEFVYTPNPHPQRFVFGHTPTRYLHPDGSDDIWVSTCGTKIGIDGGMAVNGQLNVLRIHGEHYEAFHFKNKKTGGKR